MKKLMKKLIAGIAAMTMVLAMGMTAFAADPATVTPNGKGTITITNAVKGETYTVYRLFNAMANKDTRAIVYGKAPAKELGDYFQLDDEGYVVKSAALTTEALASDQFKTWATTNGENVTHKTATANGNLTFDDLTYGYYYVTSSQGATISVDSLNPNATITDKNSSTPTVPKDAKKIVLSGGITANSTSAAVGESVNFQIKFDARNYDGDKLITKYTIKDTPTNLSIQTDTVKVQVIENPDATDSTKEIHDIKREITSGIDATGLNFDISWVDANNASKYANKSQIIVTYSATVTSGADASEAKNAAEISWNGGTPTKPDEPKVYTYSFTVQKVDGNNTATQLEGAQFKLYKSDGTEVPVVAVDASGNIITDPTAKDAHVDHYRPVATSAETGVAIVAGQATIKGLKKGQYQLEEIVAPKGYNKLSDKTDAFTVDDNSSDSGVDVTVSNNRGTELPTTGGIGTTLFYALGAALAIGAGVVLVTRKRLSK